MSWSGGLQHEAGWRGEDRDLRQAERAPQCGHRLFDAVGRRAVLQQQLTSLHHQVKASLCIVGVVSHMMFLKRLTGVL